MLKTGSISRMTYPALLLAGTATGVFPVAMPARAAAATAATQVEEITVTARYRKESAQKVPISITALPAEQIANRIPRRSPNLAVAAAVGPARNAS